MLERLRKLVDQRCGLSAVRLLRLRHHFARRLCSRNAGGGSAAGRLLSERQQLEYQVFKPHPEPGLVPLRRHIAHGTVLRYERELAVREGTKPGRVGHEALISSSVMHSESFACAGQAVDLR